MNAPTATALPGSTRSTQVGPPLQSTPSDPGRTRPVPALGPAVDRSGGPSTAPDSTAPNTTAPDTTASPITPSAGTALARCVGDVEQFASRYWGRQPLLHTQAGDTFDTFDDVFSLPALDDVIAHVARLPSVRMVADGSALAPSQYCSSTRVGGRNLDDVVDPVKVTARLAEGATLVVQSLHRTSSSVGGFVAQLQDELSHPVQANAYLTPPDAAGLAEHSDLHDVLAVQLHGVKCWWVDGLGDVTMRPGDVLYVPRGVRHRAETTIETSLHLTLGIIRVTARQVIERILQAGPELLDAPLPIGYRHRTGRDDLERHLDATLEATLDLIGATDLGAVADREQSRRLAPPPSAGRLSSIVLLDRLDLDSVIRWVAPAPLARAVDETDSRLAHWDGLRGDDHWTSRPEQFTIHLGDRTLTVPTAALDALRALSGGHPIRVGDLPGLDEASRVVLARRMVREAACVVDAFD
jgi:mannose-6-phosphate isomerase-like protein (cupin superfamily)